MHQVKSTYKVLFDRAMQESSLDDWKDWALEMMEAGYETEHLVILAGISPHINRFELDSIVNKTLDELSLHTLTRDETIYGYVYYVIDEALNVRMPHYKALGYLRDLCIDRYYDKELFPFYLLSYALEELDELGEQYYWEGANAGNIHGIIEERFKEWKKGYELRS